MKTLLTVALLGITLGAFSSCSSPDSRIRAHQSTFNSLSAVDQGKIRGGRVEIGYTEEMVLMALGDPDRRYTRTTEQGTSQIWAYQDRAPRVSLGFGIGGGGGSTGVGGGVGISTGDRRDDRVRIIFERGRVSGIEKRGEK